MTRRVLMNADGSNVARLSRSEQGANITEGDPTWDGKRVAFTRVR